ncbi:MAG TPA: hypothetical protein VM689_12455 [Aliidongia sp.]|nr:hypothetical protein [Aliidongia sp.]
MTLDLNLDKARAARLLVCISYHHAPERLFYLARVLKALAGFFTARLDVVIVTNEATEALESLCADFADSTIDCEILVAGPLAHPYELTWRHKPLIPEHFLAPGSPYSHFVYLEDDIQFSFANFCYFVTYREILRGEGLLPAFVRIEYSSALRKHVYTDNIPTLDIRHSKTLRHEDHIFVNAWNPYNAMFVLDAELAREYVASRSFGLESSKQVFGWETRERAAMGLTFEQVPDGFTARCVLPLSVKSGKPPVFSWIYHLPNNYAEDPAAGFGKLAVGELFRFGG